MIVISGDIVLSQDEASEGVNLNNPRIGWRTILTEDNVSADEEAAGFPVMNVANPATHNRWKGTTTGVQAITIELDAAELVNYFGIVGHNLGSTGASVILQGSDNGSSWSSLHTEQLLADDYAFMYEFADVEYQFYRLLITPGTEAPEISVLYVGNVLRMQRRIYVGHRPIILNIESHVSSGFSESGQFLGRVLRSQQIETQAEFKNITPSWAREYFYPFQSQAVSRPFFFAWRPGDYPNEVGYCWLMRDPTVSNQLPNGMVSLDMQFQGIR